MARRSGGAKLKPGEQTPAVRKPSVHKPAAQKSAAKKPSAQQRPAKQLPVKKAAAKTIPVERSAVKQRAARKPASLRGPALNAHAALLLGRLLERYPDAHCALDFRNAFELLCATILSAQCTDKRVNKIGRAHV